MTNSIALHHTLAEFYKVSEISYQVYGRFFLSLPNSPHVMWSVMELTVLTHLYGKEIMAEEMK